MSAGNEIINTAFYEQGTSVAARLQNIHDLERDAASHYRDMSIASTIPAIEELLKGGNPAEHATGVFERGRVISRLLLKQDGFISGHRTYESVTSFDGVSTEIAMHGLLWWGIAFRPDIGARYARLSNDDEDHGGLFGLKTGVDIVLRTTNRHWPIQAKSSPEMAEKNRYDNKIIVLTPQDILSDQTATTQDLHRAIIETNTPVLDKAWSGVLGQIQTQGAPNGRRRVI